MIYFMLYHSGTQASRDGRESILLLLISLHNCHAPSSPFLLPSPQVLISELMTDNKATIKDEDGSTPDWIELHNTGSSAVSLAVSQGGALHPNLPSDFALVPTQLGAGLL